jgi:hypothetical protein
VKDHRRPTPDPWSPKLRLILATASRCGRSGPDSSGGSRFICSAMNGMTLIYDAQTGQRLTRLADFGDVVIFPCVVARP